MEAELEKFEILNDWNINDKNAKLNVIMEQCYNKMIELYSLRKVKDNVLFHTCEIKVTIDFIKKLVDPLPSMHAIVACN